MGEHSPLALSIRLRMSQPDESSVFAVNLGAKDNSMLLNIERLIFFVTV